jgi:hypothetical protein
MNAFIRVVLGSLMGLRDSGIAAAPWTYEAQWASGVSVQSEAKAFRAPQEGARNVMRSTM